MNYENWLEKFRPVKNHLEPNAPFGGLMFETLGEELSYVRSQESKKIWTMVDADEGLYILNGYHLVNRLGYFISEVPMTENDSLEVLVYDDDEFSPIEE